MRSSLCERRLERTFLRPRLLSVKTAQFTQFFRQVSRHTVKSLSLTDSLTDRNERDDKNCVLFVMLGASQPCRTLRKLKFSRQISEKYSNIKFQANPYSGSQVVPCRQIDGQTETGGHHEANSGFSQFCELPPKTPLFLVRTVHDTKIHCVGKRIV